MLSYAAFVVKLSIEHACIRLISIPNHQHTSLFEIHKAAQSTEEMSLTSPVSALTLSPAAIVFDGYVVTIT